MKCRICDSDEHFAAKCPQGKGSGKGSGKSGFINFAGGAIHSDGGSTPDVAVSSDFAPPWATHFAPSFMASAQGEDTSNLTMDQVERPWHHTASAITHYPQGLA